MTQWINRNDAAMPFQEWRAFESDAIVQVRNSYGDSRIGLTSDFWWGYERECGEIGDGVIVSARRLDTPRSVQS